MSGGTLPDIPFLIIQPYNLAIILTLYSPIIIALIIISMSFIFQNFKGIPYLIGLIIFSSSLISCTNTSDIDINDFNVLVQTWNKAHSSKDVGVFSNLYDDKVLYYGYSLSKNVCIESKLSFFKKYPDFYQQIFGGIQIDTLSSAEFKISFVKRVTINKISSDYPSYLTFKKIDANWKITTEGDLVTDKNLNKKFFFSRITKKITLKLEIN